jgi:hypothetical protein
MWDRLTEGRDVEDEPMRLTYEQLFTGLKQLRVHPPALFTEDDWDEMVRSKGYCDANETMDADGFSSMLREALYQHHLKTLNLSFEAVAMGDTNHGVQILCNTVKAMYMHLRADRILAGHDAIITQKVSNQMAAFPPNTRSDRWSRSPSGRKLSATVQARMRRRATIEDAAGGALAPRHAQGLREGLRDAQGVGMLPPRPPRPDDAAGEGYLGQRAESASPGRGGGREAEGGRELVAVVRDLTALMASEMAAVHARLDGMEGALKSALAGAAGGRVAAGGGDGGGRARSEGSGRAGAAAPAPAAGAAPVQRTPPPPRDDSLKGALRPVAEVGLDYDERDGHHARSEESGGETPRETPRDELDSLAEAISRSRAREQRAAAAALAEGGERAPSPTPVIAYPDGPRSARAVFGAGGGVGGGGPVIARDHPKLLSPAEQAARSAAQERLAALERPTSVEEGGGTVTPPSLMEHTPPALLSAHMWAGAARDAEAREGSPREDNSASEPSRPHGLNSVGAPGGGVLAVAPAADVQGSIMRILGMSPDTRTASGRSRSRLQETADI